ncbi:hypothetical protein [Mycobacteroides abscessus]|uniref:hypothetical protein n=1 Tax=Mycobacteroides abscessus TaxID=36809 RepID=UPI0009A5899A|nr:hypothetical protein [Mycobacteroides abscessus]SKO15526.1 Uncharacterised protein [Mycobacteroides abscessus subsp. bolletii]SKX37284.1 Uncharacterised protein [Mycobacteroides abscessus subsp. bolletii]
MSSNNTKLTARERARQARADQQAREAAALADVEAFFKSTEALDDLQESYDKDVAALEERYATKRGPHESRAARAVAGLNERGDTKPSIAAQLGVTVPEVTSWIERAAALLDSEPTESTPKAAGKKGERGAGGSADQSASASGDEHGAGGADGTGAVPSAEADPSERVSA